MFYIYLSESYTCWDSKPPNEENLNSIRLGYLRILKVEGERLYGYRKDGTWREIVPGDPLRQTLSGGCPLVQEQTE